MLEDEVRAYWRLARDIRLTEVGGGDATDLRDDLDVIRMYTDHAGVRERASALLWDDLAAVGTK